MTTIDFDARYKVRGWKGVAFYVVGYVHRLEPIYDPECDEIEDVEDQTQVVIVMVGDDRKYEVNVEDLTKLEDDEYCSECGQIGCCGSR
jgi:hypothetical protein